MLVMTSSRTAGSATSRPCSQADIPEPGSAVQGRKPATEA